MNRNSILKINIKRFKLSKSLDKYLLENNDDGEK